MTKQTNNSVFKTNGSVYTIKDYRSFWNESKDKAYLSAALIVGDNARSADVVLMAYRRLYTLGTSVKLSVENLAQFIVKEAKKIHPADLSGLTHFNAEALSERERILLSLTAVFGLTLEQSRDILNCDKTYLDGFSLNSYVFSLEKYIMPIPEPLEDDLQHLIDSLTVHERRTKKRVLIIFTAVAVALALAITALILSFIFAPPSENEKYFIDGDFRYYTLDDGSLELVTYLGSSTSVVIPESTKGRNVVSIRSEAFADFTSLKSITIPKTILVIGKSAFEGCSSLQKVRYLSSHDDFMNIIISGGNSDFKSAEIIFEDQQ